MRKRIFGLLCLAAALFAVSCGGGSQLLAGEEVSPTAEAVSETPRTETAAEVPRIAVYICGCVERPGVYEVEPDSRVYQVLEMAGGLTPEAAREYLNLAERVTDGQKLTVPSLEEVRDDRYGLEGERSEAGDGRVNINTADKERLMTLPGIGEAKALAIIAWRTENGAFRNREEIMRVSGIKEGAYEKIRDLITVE